MKRRRRPIFVNRSKKEEHKAIADTLKRLMGTQAYYSSGPIRV